MTSLVFLPLALASAWSLSASAPQRLESFAHHRSLRMAAPQPEFSRPFNVQTMGKHQKVSLEATPAECLALAERFDMEGLGALDASVTVSPVTLQRERFHVRGKFSASAVQRKNLVGELLTLTIADVAFESYYGATDDTNYGLEDDDEYDELVVDGQIDLGELVAQHLYLHMSELAMAEGDEWSASDENVVFEFGDDDDEEEEGPEEGMQRPFANL